MRHDIQFDTDRLSGTEFQVVLRHLASDLAETQHRDVIVTAQCSGDAYRAHARPARSSGPGPSRPTTRNELVDALWRYYVTNEPPGTE
jgi:hypothetical protein